MNRNIRKITRMGGETCLGITIPIDIVRKLKLREKQKVVVKLRGEKITIEVWSK